jgi:hypothetical protein
MLSDSEMSFTATAFVEDDTVEGFAVVSAGHEIRLFGDRSPCKGDSFFYIAMRPSGPKARTRRGRPYR